MRRLTDAEWEVAEAPFYHLRVENAAWDHTHREHVSRWLEDLSSSGWFYEIGSTTVFERKADWFLYRLWVCDDPPAGRESPVDALETS